jgi:hypothetical protein
MMQAWVSQTQRFEDGGRTVPRLSPACGRESLEQVHTTRPTSEKRHPNIYAQTQQLGSCPRVAQPAQQTEAVHHQRRPDFARQTHITAADDREPPRRASRTIWSGLSWTHSIWTCISDPPLTVSGSGPKRPSILHSAALNRPRGSDWERNFPVHTALDDMGR